MKHHLNENYFPETYTNRVIVAVWPMSWGATLDEDSINNIAHFVHPAVTADACEVYEHPRFTEESFSQFSSFHYTYAAKSLANAKEYPKTKYIVVDAYSSIIDALNNDKMNYILLVPATYKKFMQHRGYHNEINLTEEEFDAKIDELKSKTFHLVESDDLYELFVVPHQVWHVDKSILNIE